MVARTLKHELPNYGTFDEKRVFAAGPLPEPIEWRGRQARRRRSARTSGWNRSAPHLAAAGAEMLLVPNGSPFEIDKDDLRQRLVARAASPKPACRWSISTASAGRTNWRSTARASSSTTTARSSSSCPTGTKPCRSPTGARGANGWRCDDARDRRRSIRIPQDIYHAMMVGLRDYVGAQRLPRRHPRPVGRDRQRAVGGDRGRCARRRQGVVRDAAVANSPATTASTTPPNAPRLLGLPP